MTTIAEKLTTIKNALTDIKNSIISKGQTPTGDITTYATAIDNIESGGSFTGIPREVNSSGVYGYPTENFTFSLPSNATDIKDYVLAYAFYDCDTLTSVDLSSLTKISGSQALRNAFEGCSYLTSVDLSSLTTISASNACSNAFYNCSSLRTVNLSSLTTISGYGAFMDAFRYDTSLLSINFPNLSTINSNACFYNAFYRCYSLTELSFPALTSNSFGSNTNQFEYMLEGVDGCTVHFPSNLESVIGSWSDVTSGFGGNSTQILFDLTPTS